MNDNLNKQIHEAITKNLPEQVGQTLKDELADLADYREKFPAMENRIEKQKAKIVDLSAKIEFSETRNDELIEENKLLRQKDISVQEQERNMAVILAELKMDEANERAHIVIDLVGTMVRNTEFRRSIIRSGNHDVMVQQPSGYQNKENMNNYETVEETVKEEQI